MKKKYMYTFFALLAVVSVAVAIHYLLHTNIPVLEPKGIIAQKELHLIVFALLLSLIVVIPVFGLLFAFAWRYREGNHSAKYSPQLDHSRLAETLWWSIPSAIILVLSVVAWNSSHQLDPYRPIASKNKQITIQVIALDWKWLFIYPEQHVASINFFQIPVNTPVNFELTSDAPMNSFWIPQLGSQIYAMPGMETDLHLLANQAGSYNGVSANISGSGFAGMTFVAKASSTTDFNDWMRQVKSSLNVLDVAAYNNLLEPSKNNPVKYYASAQTGLYNMAVMKYMEPTNPPSKTGASTKSQATASGPTMNMQNMDMP